MAKQPEGKLVANIKAYVIGKGGRPIKIHGGDNPFQESGISDLLICYKGYFIALEVKMPSAEKTLSKRQERFLESIRKAGGVAAVVTTVGQVARLLSELHGSEDDE